MSAHPSFGYVYHQPFPMLFPSKALVRLLLSFKKKTRVSLRTRRGMPISGGGLNAD